MQMRIGAFSPSDPMNDQRLEKLRHIEAMLAIHGATIKYAPHALDKTSALAVDAALRAQDFNTLANDDTVNVLLAITGGPACAAILPLIDYENIRRSPKAIFGFSDSCALLNAVTSQTGVITYYGPDTLTHISQSEKKLRCLLEFDPGSINTYKTDWIVGGDVCGTAIGGNLTTFAAIADTMYMPKNSEQILFWETSSNDLNRVNQLLISILLRKDRMNLKGMVIGNIGAKPAHEHIPNLRPTLESFEIPVVVAPIFGHFRENSVIIPIGKHVTLDADSKSIIF